MGGKGGGAPDPPDPEKTAKAQAEANRVDTYSPFGTVLYSGPNRRQVDITFSPDQQLIFDQKQLSSQLLGDRAITEIDRFPDSPLSYEGAYALPGDLGELRSEAERAAYDRSTSLFEPDIADAREELVQDLTQRGIPVGSELWNKEMNRFGRREDQLYTGAANDAFLMGGAEADRMFNQSRARRGQDISEANYLRGNRFNELAALLGGQQVNVPQQQPTQPIDVVGPTNLAYQGQLNAWQQGQQQQQAMMGGLFDIAGAGLPFLFCWVAREVYGDERWIEFRAWMLTRAPKWLVRIYARHGENFARTVKRRPWLKRILRPLMDMARRS